MTTLLERLRAALAPEYEVERELGSGGMGTVFLGRDIALDRPVAIKILRPELASAQGAERFLREARLLAKVKHPHIVPIHHVGERQGLSFYVMAHLVGETLAGRLAQGPLPAGEAVQLCRNLLFALEAAHEQGVVHRDIKPDNIIIERGRAVLTDFGVAKSLSDPSPQLTEPGQPVGTLEYMPPEQAGGGEVTPRTDLYAVAMVTYEAMTGRPWSILTRPKDADWSGIPRRVARALRKALAWSPNERWKDATAFHRALWVPRPQRTVWPAAAVVAVAGVVVAVIALCGPLGICPKRRPQLMVEPFQVEGVTPPRLGTNLALIVSDNLGRFPQIPLVPRNVALSGRPVHVAARVAGTVSQRGDTLVVRLEVRDSLGRRLHSAHLAGHAGAEVELADGIVLQVLRWLYPELPARYGPRPAWGLNAAALAEFLQGEDAFRRDAWSEAARHFREALRLDPSFARAAWRLANAQRWRRQPAGVDLRAVLARQSRFLMPLDSLLIAAELAPHGESRYRIYRQALALYPNDPYARLLYGSELMHRGPLAGVPLDSGAAVLEEAVAQDPHLAPAHDQLVWALIRLGRREDARRALDRMGAVMRDHLPSSDFNIVGALEVAFAGRFQPDSVPSLPAEVRQDLARTLRFGLGFDAPALQLELARQLLAAPADASQRASAHEARGLALVGLGRPAQALMHFDSAAARFGTSAVRLEASEWRVLPGALGVPGVPPADVRRGRAALAAAARGRGPVAVRAAWASGVDAYAHGDSSAGRGWRERVRELATGNGALERLGVLLDALDLAVRGDSVAALHRSATLLPFEEWRGLGDPFFRTVLHVRRAEWLEGRSRPDSADRQWLWYENTDFDAWLTDTLQAAEIDWAFGAWARSRRGALSMASGDRAAGCAQLERTVELWAGAEPPYEPLVREARRLREDCTR